MPGPAPLTPGLSTAEPVDLQLVWELIRDMSIPPPLERGEGVVKPSDQKVDLLNSNA